MSSTEYADLAQRTTRAKFVEACPFPFLVGARPLQRPHGPQPTMTFDAAKVRAALDGEDVTGVSSMPEPKRQGGALVLAVRKVQEAFPAMITVGRTANNDIVVADVEVSKFHAYFRSGEGGLDLTDVGSRNGTWAAGRKLSPKTPVALAVGDTVRFANVAFVLCDAGQCWDQLRAARR
jgi:hypothetical protein